jgi:hypothetical protein
MTKRTQDVIENKKNRSKKRTRAQRKTATADRQNGGIDDPLAHNRWPSWISSLIEIPSRGIALSLAKASACSTALRRCSDPIKLGLMFLAPGLDALNNNLVHRPEVTALDFLLHQLLCFRFDVDCHRLKPTPWGSGRQLHHRRSFGLSTSSFADRMSDGR